jgi:hypothetical protein
MRGRPRAIFPTQDGRQERVKIDAPAPIEGCRWAVKSIRCRCGWLSDDDVHALRCHLPSLEGLLATIASPN